MVEYAVDDHVPPSGSSREFAAAANSEFVGGVAGTPCPPTIMSGLTIASAPAAATGASASDAWAASLAQLAAPTTNLRSEALDQITLLLQEADWRLVGVGAPELVEALRARLSDSNWSVSQKCLLLIGDLVSDADEEVDVLVRSELLPGLLAKISDSKVVVRKAASQACAAYIAGTREPQSVAPTLVRLGFESADWKQRQATALFLSLSSTPLERLVRRRPPASLARK